MRATKVIGLGIFFSFVGFFALLVISIMRGPLSSETSHATGLSAVVGGIIEGLLNPISLLVIVVAFVAATWLTRKTSKGASTS
jgi:di/tricarboxylate transporter